MSNLVLESLYFFLPAYVANMSPQIASWLNLFPSLNKPIDSYIKPGLLGKNKTVRGFLSGVIVALLFGILQFLGMNIDFFNSISILDYSNIWIALSSSFLLGFGALFGDSVKSFFKRMRNIKSGQPWIGADQMDYVIGGLIFVLPFFMISWYNILFVLVFSPIAHVVTNIIAYNLRIKKVWW